MWEGSVEPEQQGRRVGVMPEGVARSPGELWPGNWSPVVKKSCFWSPGTSRDLQNHLSELNFFFHTESDRQPPSEGQGLIFLEK